MAQNSNIRRIDELGRIVIPKDVRKKLHIKESEPLEIYIDNDEIHIKKYSALPDIIEYIKYLLDMGSRITENEYILTTREEVLASTDDSFTGKTFGEDLKNLVLTCTERKNEDIRYLIDDSILMGRANIIPIIIDNDRTGLLIEYSKDNTLNETNTLKIFANLIEKQLSNY